MRPYRERPGQPLRLAPPRRGPALRAQPRQDGPEQHDAPLAPPSPASADTVASPQTRRHNNNSFQRIGYANITAWGKKAKSYIRRAKKQPDKFPSILALVELTKRTSS